MAQSGTANSSLTLRESAFADAGLRALLKMPPKPHDKISSKSKKKLTGKRKSAK